MIRPLHERFMLGLVVALLAVAPAYAASGWYLLVPPHSNYNAKAEFLHGYRILANDPLSNWNQKAAYDSAYECESAKLDAILVAQKVAQGADRLYQEALRAHKSSSILEFQRANADARNADEDALLASRCIKSNDPRLAE